MAKQKAKLALIHPGEVLFEEFMRPNALSQNRLARDLDVNPARINDIVHGRSSITAAVALRLGKYFRTSPEFWLNLQSDYDLRRARAGDWTKIEPRIRTLATAE
jgi:addiction module HigA family antidote